MRKISVQKPILILIGWRDKYASEIDPMQYNAEISDEERKVCAVRRRIEDIKEAARIEREGLDEVWE